MLSDPRVRRALAVGSHALIDALERFEQGGLTRRDAERLQAKVLRYLIRMTTRPTPFGLFAGVALGQWGVTTDLSIATTSARIRTRPDMAWLLALVFELERQPEVRRSLHLVSNPAAVIRGDRVILPERAPSADGEEGTTVSVRATGVVKRALTLARRPVLHADLASQLLARTPGATAEQVENLLTELWQQTLLLTNLRPPLTTDDPARYVADRLASIPAAAEQYHRMESVMHAAAAWDALSPEEAVASYRQLTEQAKVVHTVTETPFEVDMALGLSGRHISTQVGVEAARTAELLLRMTPLPAGLPYLDAYRQAFISRYGHDREVPLLEMLDPEVGLGPPPMHGHGGAIPPAKAAERARTLLELATRALYDHSRSVELDGDLVERLQTWSDAAPNAPPSLDVNVFVAARSPEALDAGEFQVILGPNLGALAAGRNLGRFADLLAPQGTAALQSLAKAEEAIAADQIWAELVYLPPHFRSTNVVIRPPVRNYEIALAASPGVGPSQVILLGDLVVGVRHGRFYLRWPAVDRDVKVTSGHMLNSRSAPPVARFLVDAGMDGQAVLSTFEWGPAEEFPFLPRVQAGRVILRPAQWRITKKDLWTEQPGEFSQAVTRWRRRWDAPRYVFLGMADNRLILDLEDEAQREELRAEMRDLQPGGHVLLQEVLPAPNQVWTPGPGGHYVIELVVSLVAQRSQAQPAEEDKIDQADGDGGQEHQIRRTRDEILSPESVTLAVEETRSVDSMVPANVRSRPPGSDWLFVKLYCPRSFEEDLIAGPMSNFARLVVSMNLADEWFFIRYADPDPHIRLRFRGQAPRLSTQLLPAVCAWGKEVMESGQCLRFSLDTYDREVERYGGPQGMALAESLFCADSSAVTEMLRLILAGELQLDRMALAIVSVDTLLGGLGLSEGERLQWYKRQSNSWDEVGPEYRQRKTVLRSLLAGQETGRLQLAGGHLETILNARTQALEPVATHLRDFADQALLSQPLDTLYRSYVHLHLNRLAGLDWSAERTVLGLLSRTRDGLERSRKT